MGLPTKLDMKRPILAGATLLSLAMAGCTPPPPPPVATSPANELVFKAPPSPGYVRKVRPVKPPPPSASKNDALYQQYLEWRKKHPQ
jgi:hypothetical protein